jgi:hypothetical protein
MWHACKEMAIRGLPVNLLIATLDFCKMHVAVFDMDGEERFTVTDTATGQQYELISYSALVEIAVARFRRMAMEAMQNSKNKRR